MISYSDSIPQGCSLVRLGIELNGVIVGTLMGLRKASLIINVLTVGTTQNQMLSRNLHL